MSEPPTFFQRHHHTVIAGMLLLAPVIAWGCWGALKTNDNNIRQWLPDDYPETQAYDEFRRRFGSDEFAFITWEGCTLGDARLEAFANRALRERHPKSGEPLFARVLTGSRLVETLVEAPSRISREQAIDRLVGIVIARDRKTTAALVTLAPAAESDRVLAIDALRRIATEQIQIPRQALKLSGEPVINAAVDVASHQAILSLLPWAVMLTSVIAYACLRRIWWTLSVFFVAIYCGAIAEAMVYFSGAKMNLVLVVMPVLVYVLAFSGAIHLVNYYWHAINHGDREVAPSRAVMAGWIPCTLAASTTAVGMGSLIVSHISPIKYFGYFSAVGTIGGLVLVFLALPSLMVRWKSAASKVEFEGSSLRVRRWSHWLIRHHLWLNCLGLLLLATLAYGLQFVHTSVNTERFFSPRSRLTQDLSWTTSKFGPRVPIEVLLEFNTADSSLSMLDRLQIVDRLQQHLAAMPDVGGIISPATFVRTIEDTRSPTLRSVYNKRLLRQRDHLSENHYLSVDGNKELWRISARVGSSGRGGDVTMAVQQHVDQFLSGLSTENRQEIAVQYTGVIPLFRRAQQELFDSLYKSFLLAFVLIAGMVFLLLRNLLAVAITMIPNVFPAVIVFGTMGWSGAAVDVGAMMTASVAIGIAVDGTLHFLHWFQRSIDEGGSQRDAIVYAYRQCSAALIQTTAIVSLGMLVFALSSFEPVSQFGWLLFGSLGLALVGDLVLLPALLAGPAGRMFIKQATSTSHRKGIVTAAN